MLVLVIAATGFVFAPDLIARAAAWRTARAPREVVVTVSVWFDGRLVDVALGTVADRRAA